MVSMAGCEGKRVDSTLCRCEFDRDGCLSKVEEVGGSFRWQRKRCALSHVVT